MAMNPAICVLMFGLVGIIFCQTTEEENLRTSAYTAELAGCNAALQKVRLNYCLESIRKAIKEVMPAKNELHYSAGTKAYEDLNRINSRVTEGTEPLADQTIFLYTYKRDIIFCDIKVAEEIRRITYEAVEEPYEPAHVIIHNEVKNQATSDAAVACEP